MNEISVTAAACTVISSHFTFYRRQRTAPYPYLLQTSRAPNNKLHSPRVYTMGPAFFAFHDRMNAFPTNVGEDHVALERVHGSEVVGASCRLSLAV